MGTENWIGLPPDGTGKKTAAQQRSKVGVNNIQRQVFIGDMVTGAISGAIGTVTGIGEGIGLTTLYIYLKDAVGQMQYTEKIMIGTDEYGTCSETAVNLHTAQSAVSDPDNPSNSAHVDKLGGLYTRFTDGNPELNAFGALNTASDYILGEYRFPYNSSPDQWVDTRVGTSTMTYDSASSSVLLAVGSAAGDSIKRTTYRYHTYTAGQSHLIRFSGAYGDGGKTGLTRRVGYFNETDGIFFELKDNVRSTVLRSSVTGSMTEERIPQTEWNGDQLFGNGNSGVVLEAAVAVTGWIEFQWYGAGRVRMGIIGPDGSRIVCHEFQKALKANRPYMALPTLPVTFEMFNHGVTNSASEMRIIAATVATSGVKPWNRSIYGINNSVPIHVAYDSPKLLYAITLKPTFFGKINRSGIGGGDLTIAVKGSGQCKLHFWVGRGPSGYPTTTFTDHTHPLSAVQIGLGGAPVIDATNYIFFSQLITSSNIGGGVTRIPYADIVEVIKTELRRSPDNTFSMISACSIEVLYPGDEVDVFYTVNWHETK